MKWDPREILGVVAVALVVSVPATAVEAQTIRHDTGQDVGPVFEGWEANADGSYNFLFGYLNRNYEEQVDVPIGPANFFDAGPQDRGQPTHFYTRRQRFVFRVRVPKDWEKNRKLVWTLTAHGKTNQAKGWLEPEWELNPGVISENSNGGVLEAGNKPPVVSGSTSRAASIQSPVKLSVTATDDGLPKPRPRRMRPPDSAAAAAAATAVVAAANPDTPIRLADGMRVKWLWYRGPGKVTFEPDASKPEYKPSASYETTATFKEPGTYVIRALVSDGQLETAHDITITVR